MLNKERAAGYYRLSAFYLAKVVSELPLILLQPSIFIAVVYWMTGLQGFLPFIKMWAHVILEAFTSQSIGFFMGALITDVDIGLKSVIVFMLCSLISGGFYVRTAPSWSYWLKYVSYMYYIYSGFLTFQFTGLELSCLPQNRTSYCTALYEFGGSNGTYYTSDASLEPTFGDTTSMNSLNNSQLLSFSGDRVLETLGLTWAEWLYPLALGGFALVFQSMAYTMLRYVHRP